MSISRSSGAKILEGVAGYKHLAPPERNPIPSITHKDLRLCGFRFRSVRSEMFIARIVTSQTTSSFRSEMLRYLRFAPKGALWPPRSVVSINIAPLTGLVSANRLLRCWLLALLTQHLFDEIEGILFFKCYIEFSQ